MVRANPAMASPLSVSRTSLVSRLIRVRFAAVSSLRMCWLMVGWARPSRSAALVKLKVSATAKNERNWAGSNTALPVTSALH